MISSVSKAASGMSVAAGRRLPAQCAVPCRTRQRTASHNPVVEYSRQDAEASTSSASNWAVIQVSNGPQRQAFSQFVEEGRAFCVQAKALSRKVGERIRFNEVMAYKRGNEALQRSGKNGFLNTVCVEGIVADEFQAPTVNKKPGLKLQKVLITKIKDLSERAK